MSVTKPSFLTKTGLESLFCISHVSDFNLQCNFQEIWNHFLTHRSKDENASGIFLHPTMGHFLYRTKFPYSASFKNVSLVDVSVLSLLPSLAIYSYPRRQVWKLHYFSLIRRIVLSDECINKKLMGRSPLESVVFERFIERDLSTGQIFLKMGGGRAKMFSFQDLLS